MVDADVLIAEELGELETEGFFAAARTPNDEVSLSRCWAVAEDGGGSLRRRDFNGRTDTAQRGPHG